MQRNISIGGIHRTVSSDDQYLAQMPEASEPEMSAIFQALIRPDMVVADVGANIGLTALLFSQLARKTFAFSQRPAPLPYCKPIWTPTKYQTSKLTT